MRPLVFALSAVLVLGQTDPSVLAENHVTIPVAEYNRLTDAAAATAKRRVDPPPAYVIRSAEFRLQAEKGIATGVLEIRGEVLAKGAVVIPLVSGLNIRDAQLGGKAIPLVIQGGKHTTVIEGPAEFAIQLGCSRALLNEPGRAGISFPAISAGMVKASVSLPGEETAIQLLPGMMESRSSSGGRTLVKATLVPDKAAQLTWSARLAPPTAPAAPPKPLRFLSDLKTLINVSESDLTMSVLADVTVIQGEASRFELAVPQGFEVAAADGGTIAHTEAKAGSVIVHVTSPSIRSHQFLISLAKPFGADKTGLAIPGLVGAQRETGEVLVEGQGTLELIAKERGGLRRMDLREVSSQLRTLSAASMCGLPVPETRYRISRRGSRMGALPGRGCDRCVVAQGRGHHAGDQRGAVTHRGQTHRAKSVAVFRARVVAPRGVDPDGGCGWRKGEAGGGERRKSRTVDEAGVSSRRTLHGVVRDSELRDAIRQERRGRGRLAEARFADRRDRVGGALAAGTAHN
ncbi:MAG: hypothetical protein U0Q16_20700 [Bryobacteraceae bacterium]